MVVRLLVLEVSPGLTPGAQSLPAMLWHALGIAQPTAPLFYEGNGLTSGFENSADDPETRVEGGGHQEPVFENMGHFYFFELG
jgi:hypothetical protein